MKERDHFCVGKIYSSSDVSQSGTNKALTRKMELIDISNPRSRLDRSRSINLFDEMPILLEPTNYLVKAIRKATNTEQQDSPKHWCETYIRSFSNPIHKWEHGMLYPNLKIKHIEKFQYIPSPNPTG